MKKLCLIALSLCLLSAGSHAQTQNQRAEWNVRVSDESTFTYSDKYGPAKVDGQRTLNLTKASTTPPVAPTSGTNCPLRYAYNNATGMCLSQPETVDCGPGSYPDQNGDCSRPRTDECKTKVALQKGDRIENICVRANPTECELGSTRDDVTQKCVRNPPKCQSPKWYDYDMQACITPQGPCMVGWALKDGVCKPDLPANNCPEGEVFIIDTGMCQGICTTNMVGCEPYNICEPGQRYSPLLNACLSDRPRCPTGMTANWNSMRCD